MPYRAPTTPRGNRHLPLLDEVAIKTSCRASWDQMVGDATTRFCCICSKNVHDLTAMHPDDAVAFLAQHLSLPSGGPCVRIYRRHDGRVLTSECPTGEDRRHLGRFARALAIGAAGAAIAAVGIDIASRPTLGPTYAEEPTVAAPPYTTMRFDKPAAYEMGELADRDMDRADVNATLRSDEPTTAESESEGSGPARRRYVRPDPSDAVIKGTTTLVTDTAGIREGSRRRRRDPAL